MASARRLRQSTRQSSPTAFSVHMQTPVVLENGPAKDSQESLDRWLEPTPRAPRPSWADNPNANPYGVLEHMQPLGQPPTSKILQRLKVSTRPHHRQSHVQDYAEVTSESGVDRVDTASPAETMSIKEVHQLEVVEPVAVLAPLSDETDGIQHASTPLPIDPALVDTVVTPLPPLVEMPSPRTPRQPQQILPAHVDNYVEFAIRKADQTRSPRLIPGLRQLREQAKHDPSLCELIDAIVLRRQTPEQSKIFKHFIKKGIKRYKNSETLGDANIDPLLMQPMHSPAVSSDKQISPVVVKSPASNRGVNPPSSFPFYSGNPSPLRYAAPALMPSYAPVAHGSSSPGPSQGATITELAEQAPAESSAVATKAANRSRSLSSSSVLSSAKSLDADTFAPTIETEPEFSMNGAKKAPRPSTRQGTAAEGKIPASRNAHSSFFLNNKASYPNRNHAVAYNEIDSQDLERRQRQLTEQSFTDYQSHPAEDSNERTVIKSRHLPRPVTPFSDAPPPPVIHPHRIDLQHVGYSSPLSEPANEGEPHALNGTSRKRSRHEMESDDDPLSELGSPTPPPHLKVPSPGPVRSSRSNTPRKANLPPAKKARKSARVIQS